MIMNLSFNSKHKPYFVSVSPVRPESKSNADTALLEIYNKNDNKMSQELKELSESVETKRLELNKLYKDASDDNSSKTVSKLQKLSSIGLQSPPSSTPKETTSNNILKHVHFEFKNTNNSINNNLPHQFNSTFTVKINQQKSPNKPLVSIGNRQDRSKSPKKSIKPIQPISSLHPTSKPTQIAAKTTKSPTTNLTLQQKRHLQLEAKNKLDKQLEILRAKVIKRKFAYIWLRKYCGNSILPSRAKSWHRDCVLQRNEWRSMVKAKCHHNYVISNKAWECWKEFVIHHKQETKSEKIATNFYNNSLKMKYFNEWKSFRVDSNMQQYNLKQIQLKKNLDLLKDCFHFWSIKFISAKKLNKMSEIADKHFELIQLSKCYAFWYYKFANEKEDRTKLRMALQHYKLDLLKKCFNSLCMYTTYRRKKKIQKFKLKQYAESQLVYRVYQTWMQKYEVRVREIVLEEDISEFKRKYLLIRIFKYWKTSMSSKKDLRVREIKMKKFYEKNLKKKCFNSLKSNYLQENEIKLDYIRAENFEKFWRKKDFFSKWLDKLEEKNDIKTMHLAYKGSKHYDAKLVRHFFKEWILFVKEQRELNIKINIADNNYTNLLFRKYFQKVRNFTELNKKKRENHEKAIEFYKNNTYYRIFARWFHKYEFEIESQMNTRIAILHHESQITTSTFTQWFLKYQFKLRMEYNENRSVNFYKRNLIKKSIKTWKSFVNEAKFELTNESIALKHDFKRITLPLFKAWKQHLNNCQLFHKKCENAENYYKKKLSKKVFKSWQKHTKVFKLINQQVNVMFNLKQKEKCIRLFNHWRNETREIKTEKKNEILADAFHLKNLMLNSLKAWNLYTAGRVLKRAEERLIIEKFQKSMSNLVLKNIFDVWKRRSGESIRLNNKEQNSKRVYDSKLAKKTFMAWRIYLKLTWRKKVLNSQAQWFLETRFKTEFYFKWKTKYESECTIREKNQKALIYWSITIQKKSFVAWLDWVRFKKHKKSRYSLAIEQRQLDILKICGRNFLNYSMDARVRRMFALRHLKEKNLIDTNDLLIKYFRIWYNKCNFKISKISIEPKIDKLVHEINDGYTLTKRETVKDSTYVPVKLDVLSKVRPSPRKPTFLNESNDFTQKALPVTKYNDFIKIKDTEVNKEKTFNKALLLPPSAFSTSKNEVCVDNETSLISSSLSTIDRNEMSFELKNIMSFHDISLPPFNSGRKHIENDFNSNDKPKQDNSKMEHEHELVELKRRLENLSKKSEKLKSLKEQEQLLENCLQSNEINKSSICETIYEEKEQVLQEIEELKNFIRNEKQECNQIIKKHKI